MINKVKNFSIKSLLVFSLLAMVLLNPTKIDAASPEYYTHVKSSSYNINVKNPTTSYKQYAYTQQQLRITNYSTFDQFKRAFFNEYVSGNYAEASNFIDGGEDIHYQLVGLWNNRYNEPVIVGDIYWYTGYGRGGVETSSRRWAHIFVGSSTSNISKRFAICSNVYYFKQMDGRF